VRKKTDRSAMRHLSIKRARLSMFVRNFERGKSSQMPVINDWQVSLETYTHLLIYLMVNRKPDLKTLT
jgi:hypothetical protein